MRIYPFAFITLATISIMAQDQPFTPSSALSVLRNQDVKWEGTYVGLTPTITGAASNFLLNHPIESRPVLIEALNDKDRFVVAHVLLTFMENSKFGFSSSNWNGLRVTLESNGNAVIHPKQRTTLYNFWHAKYGSA